MLCRERKALIDDRRGRDHHQRYLHLDTIAVEDFRDRGEAFGKTSVFGTDSLKVQEAPIGIAKTGKIGA